MIAASRGQDPGRPPVLNASISRIKSSSECGRTGSDSYHIASLSANANNRKGIPKLARIAEIPAEITIVPIYLPFDNLVIDALISTISETSVF